MFLVYVILREGHLYMKRLLFLSIVFSLVIPLSGCLFEHEWYDIDEETSIENLEQDFIYIEEMTIIYGRARGVGLFGWEWAVEISLPTTLAPQDWLAYFNTELDNVFTMEDKFYYIQPTSFGGPPSRTMKYIEEKDIYLLTYYFAD